MRCCRLYISLTKSLSNIQFFSYMVKKFSVDDDVLLQTMMAEENELSAIFSLDHRNRLSLFKTSETLSTEFEIMQCLWIAS